MKEIDELINQLEANIEFENLTDLTISKVGVGWHIDHSLKVLNGVIAVLKNSNPEEYKKKFNLMKELIFLLGFIPRGKAKAPKAVRSFETITKEDLLSQVATAKKNSSEIQNLNPKSFFKHPHFNDLNLKETLYFLKLHTKHHLKIINDIKKGSK
jgi:hypothetical protein